MMPPMKKCRWYIAILFANFPLAAQADVSQSVPAEGYQIEEILPPSQTHGVHGLKVGPDGALYVGDILGLTLWRIDLGSGEAEPFIGPPLGMADDLAFGPNGMLVWTHIFDGVVYGRRTDGTIITIAIGLPGINSIGFAADGRLFATQLVDEDRLLELDPAGKWPPKVILDGVEGLNGFFIDERGILWGPEGKQGNVIALDLATLERRVVASGFIWPTGVVRGPGDLLYVNDLTAGTLTEINHQTGTRRLIHQFLPGTDNAAVGPDGTVYVSSPGDNSIYAVNPETGTVRPIRQGYLSVPGGVAVISDPAGDQVFVADLFDWKKVDPESGYLTSLGRHPGKPIIQATNINADGTRLVLSHWYYGTVRLIDGRTGQILRTISDLPAVQDAVVLDDGTIVASLRDRGQLVAIASDDSRTILADGLRSPVALVRLDDDLVVSEADAGTVVRIDPRSGHRMNVADGLARPEGLAMGQDGTLFVVESGAKRVTAIRSDGTRYVIASGLPLGIEPASGMPDVWVINGIATGNQGSLYVTSDETGALLRLIPATPESQVQE